MKRGVSVLAKQTAVGDVDTNKALEDLRRVVDGKRNLFDGAVILKDVVVTTAAFARVAHGLRRRVRGYWIVRTKTAPGAAFSLYDDNDNRTDSDRFLYLQTVGADVTVDLVVF